MSLVLTASQPIAVAGFPTGKRLSAEKLRAALLWLMGFAGAFVFIEPSPYEVVGVLAIVLFAITGLAFRAALMPLVMLLVLLNIGYAMALIGVIDKPKLLTWVLVSVFLAGTAIFYAAVLGTNTQARLSWLMRGVLAAGVVASLVALGAYFRVFGGLSDMFVLFGRARGTFNDPNVLGAFLVLPGMLAFQRVLSGRLTSVVGSGILLLIMMAALFLSFSRAAWGQFVLAGLLLMAMTFLTSQSPRERFRLTLIAMVGIAAVVALLAVLISIGQVADLLKQRATLEQSYDIGPLGRFGRYILGFQVALERPFGIGPLQFSSLLGSEDPHNSLLNAFMTGGWLGGFAFLTLTVVTVAYGFRYAFVRTPWQSGYHVIYATYLGIVAESVIIDIDHWRHYFLVLGVLWGLIAASRAYLAQPQAAA